VTTKAERSRGMPRRSVETQAPPSRLPIIIGGALLLVLAVAAIAAIAMSAAPSGSVAEPASRPVAISGDALPAFSDPASDAAVGRPLPQLSGTGVDGQPVSFGPGDGPMAVVVLAHWCAYCQSEVPPLVSYLDADRLPDGVSLVALTTSIDPARPNYPPSRWLENEGWTVPTLIDDASNRGLQALGMSSFPAFVFVDADGRVAYRNTGALGAENFHAIVEQLAR
jgi:thiol-disulfide isomerase/thioredoxin